MKNWLKGLNIYYQTVIISFAVLVILSIATIWLYFIGWKEIPIGYMVGCVVGEISYIITAILEDKFQLKKTTWPFIIMNVVRVVLIGGILFLTGYLYYARGIKVMNIFAEVVGYTSVIVCLIVLSIKKKA